MNTHSETLTALGVDNRTEEQKYDEYLAALGNLRTTCLLFSRQSKSFDSLKEAINWFETTKSVWEDHICHANPESANRS